MTDRETMKALVLKAYAARDSGDIEGLMVAFHPDPIFELLGAKTSLDVTGAVKGHPEIRASMNEFIEVFKFDNRRIISFVADADRAAVHSRIDVTFVPTNQTVATNILDLFKFEDGKIIELLEFADTALVKDLITPD